MELSADPAATLPLEPGLWRADPYFERYTVPPCGSIIFELLAGDQITVTDPEGAQPGELIAFSTDGRCAPASLCDTSPQEAAGFQKILASNEPSARQVAAGLKRRGISPANARAIPLFGPETHPGSAQDYTARDDILCVVCAPGSPMAVDSQFSPTSLAVYVNRKSGKTLQEPALPEPLAEPRLELRIDKCTAGEYLVHAGEYIQIIDVAGRECSDFLALCAAGLDQGKERHIDMTTTRTLIGSGYPGPGL